METRNSRLRSTQTSMLHQINGSMPIRLAPSPLLYCFERKAGGKGRGGLVSLAGIRILLYIWRENSFSDLRSYVYIKVKVKQCRTANYVEPCSFVSVELL